MSGPVRWGVLGSAKIAGALLIGRLLSTGVMREAGIDSGTVAASGRALAGVSIALWIAAIASGRFLAYTYDVLMATDLYLMP